MKSELRDFLYLDWERIRSLSAQLFQGIPENLETQTGNDISLDADVEGSALGLLKGQIGSDYRYFRTQNETRSFHHHIYSLVEERLSKDKILTKIDHTFDFSDWTPKYFHDGQFVLASGVIRLIDYSSMTNTLELLPTMMDAALHAARLASKDNPNEQSKQQEKLRQNLKSMNINKIVPLIQAVYGETIRVKIVPSNANPTYIFVGTANRDNFQDAPTSLVQKYGYEVDANWLVLGEVNYSKSSQQPAPLPVGNELEDSLETLVLSVNQLARVANAAPFPVISITPISIYRRLG